MEVTVVKVYEGTPAEEAGLKNGDEILSVDKYEATSMELSNLVKKIRGKEGTKVHLKVYRSQTGENLELDVERKNVDIPSVDSKMLSDGIGYIQISEFQSNTAKQFKKALLALEKEDMKGLIDRCAEQSGRTGDFCRGYSGSDSSGGNGCLHGG